MSILVMILISISCQAQQETVSINPTWGQAFKYANGAGQVLWTVIGLLLLAGAAVLLYMAKSNRIKLNPTGLSVSLFIIVAASMASFFSKPAAIKWNNTKVVDKIYYDRVGEQHIWDSLENNCLIVDGPYNCK